MTVLLRSALCAALLALATSFGMGADLTSVKRVYLLPMSGGMDHYLAVQLTQAGFVQVVTDPMRADAVITDRIGGSFEESLDELFAPPATKKDDRQDGPAHAKMQPLTRGRGSLFLVDRNSRVVLWSMFAPSPGPESAKMNKLAASIAANLQKAWKGDAAAK